MKVALIGGGGVRTPLLIQGLVRAEAPLGIHELTLYDISRDAVELMAALGRDVVRQYNGGIRITTPATLEESVDGADFVLSSIRVGGIEARARDERIAIDHGLTGQETTGPCGLAMALRTIPVVLEHARTIERVAPDAWLISFTNPAGLITQALRTHTRLRAVGICDTPSELFHRIAEALESPVDDVRCDYLGLNHLGWVRRVWLRDEDVTARLLADDALLGKLYPAKLLEPGLIRSLGLIPTEYLFFYYERQRAYANQVAARTSRGEEIVRLNAELFENLQTELAADRAAGAVEWYRRYLRRRSGSYMRLEAHAEKATETPAAETEDPFDAATGYHRIAIDVMSALKSEGSSRIVVNVENQGAIEDMNAEDVVEVPCRISREGARPIPAGSLPAAVRGLVHAVKEYERLTIRAAVEKSTDLARLALVVHPLVSDSTLAGALVESMFGQT